MAHPPTAEEQVRFLLNLQRLLEKGRFVATYKHAFMLSIADVCLERGNDSGGRFRIPTAELAEKFIAYYWHQAVPYPPASRTSARAVLKQSTGRQAAVVSPVSKARDAHGGSLAQLKKNPPAWKI